ncbi:MAG: hypothetical protein D8M52_00855 [Chlorobi bacterium]|nr:MAG: hypothetical protein F9K28_00395 [Bacteroidota bacterium]KXK35754.1 MAG: hypothetical protein UZ06_CHB003000219 [Chlorobi bacterium OLB6]MBE2265284.1 hypothetical protein [Flavobacteriales bacterium]MBL1160253.1 hypothetical protein [Chlorobiota bacterium]MBW7853391.1 hypothetical protein [Candidatus Kapabacteria bacterium]MCC6330438.1 hypothetical protein [Ignavibacteria bacterium]
MLLSADTEAVLGYLDQAVKGGFRKRSDIGVLLEVAAQRDAPGEFNAITITGATVWQIYSELRRLRQGDAGFRHLEDEFMLNVNKLRFEMAELLSTADEVTFSRFDTVYFGTTQGVVRNVVDVAHDLSKIRELQGNITDADDARPDV